MPSFAEILGPEKVEELSTIDFETSPSPKPKNDRYKPYREMLDDNDELRVNIQEVFGRVNTVPAIHITSRAFRTETDIQNSGFIDNIMENNFRARDTNVGVFMQREGTRQPASPSEFVEKPEKFLRELETLLSHYYHHGIRTNKAILGDQRNIGVGIPVMLLVDISDVLIEPGSDYEDHYIFSQNVSGIRVIGEINLQDVATNLRENLPQIAKSFIDLTEAYVEKSSQQTS